jgi:hypothetical protein
MGEPELLAASNAAASALRDAKAAKVPKAELTPLIDALKAAKKAYKVRTFVVQEPPNRVPVAPRHVH